MQEWEKRLSACMLCPRRCKANRLAGERGVCGAAAAVRAARAALHMWEEPCISGTRGCGAVFFSGCPLHCVYCQNEKIAGGEYGIEISPERLAEIFLELQEKGANNINLVTPGHYVPQIQRAIDIARAQRMALPIVYNTGGYESVETIRSLEGYVDVYLPDLKYMDAATAEKYSHAPDYFFYARRAIEEMVRQSGPPRFVTEKTIEESVKAGRARWKEERQMGPEEYGKLPESDTGILVRGTLVRHLLLPGGLWDAKRIVNYLLETYGGKIYISLLNQYTPGKFAANYKELSERVEREDYEALVDYAIACGIENGFIQEADAADEAFIPEFDGSGIQ